MSAPSRPVPHAPLMDRREGAELRDMVRAAVEGTDAVAALLQEAEQRSVARFAEAARQIAALTERVEQQDREIARLRAGRGEVRPPSRAQVMRDLVLAYFVSMPGVKLTPQVVDLNCADLPDDRSDTATANACKELANAGKLRGGGTRDRANREKGIYWYEAPAEES